MKIDSLTTLLEEELKDIYDAEKRLVKALPKMAKAATSQELREAFLEHLEQTKGQVERLEQAFELLGKPAKAKTCNGMKGLIEEGDEVGEENFTEDTLRDAALIGAAQRVEHYEIAAYGTARTLAERTGNSEIAELLEATLNEEKETDELLTSISMTLLEGMDEEGAEEGEETAPAAKSSGKRTRTSKA